MSVLLRQPRGFEGFGASDRNVDPDDLAVAKSPDSAWADRQLRCPARAAQSGNDDHLSSPTSMNSSIEPMSSTRRAVLEELRSPRGRDRQLDALRCRDRRGRSSDVDVGVAVRRSGVESPRLNAHRRRRRTISTFSCDIARAVSRRLRSRRERCCVGYEAALA